MQVASKPGTYWQWQGNSIYYVKSGSRQPGRPPLLLIHGFGASTDHWKKNIAGLDRDFEVWAIDLLGFGRSAKPNLEYGGSLWRDQLHDFITEVIGTPAVLAGNSLGGYSALCLAAERPSSAAGLILLNSAGPFSEVETKKKSNPLQDSIGKSIRFVLLQSWANYFLFKFVQRKSFIRQTLEKVYLDRSAVTEELIEDLYRPSLDKGAPQVFASVFKSRQGKKVDELLSELKCPLLMLWGEGDPWMNARDKGEKFRQYYPQLTEYYLQAGHCPHDEIPDRVNELISSWVLALN
ncbi:MAG: alpha/beta fold hydrolase [Prochloraceae cyanobacterium]